MRSGYSAFFRYCGSDLKDMEESCFRAARFWGMDPFRVLSLPLSDMCLLFKYTRKINREEQQAYGKR